VFSIWPSLACACASAIFSGSSSRRNSSWPFFTAWFCCTATSTTRPATCEEIISRSALT
jgi:hypothetical protein